MIQATKGPELGNVMVRKERNLRVVSPAQLRGSLFNACTSGSRQQQDPAELNWRCLGSTNGLNHPEPSDAFESRNRHPFILAPRTGRFVAVPNLVAFGIPRCWDG